MVGALQGGETGVRPEVGDIRKLPLPANALAAAFCDKVLIHAGPAPASLGELARVTKLGVVVGVIDRCRSSSRVRRARRSLTRSMR